MKPSTFELDVLHAILDPQQGHYPLLLAQISHLNVIRREITGVGGYVYFDSKGVVKFFDGQTMKEAVWDGFKEFKLLITHAP